MSSTNLPKGILAVRQFSSRLHKVKGKWHDGQFCLAFKIYQKLGQKGMGKDFPVEAIKLTCFIE